MRYIYALIDPKTEAVKYVGQTDNIKRRFNDHISSSLNPKSDSYETYKARWIRKLSSENLKPIIEILEECDDYNQSNQREKYYVNKFTVEGYNLTNSYVSDVTEFSEVTKEKMSKAKKGKKLEEIVGAEKAEELRLYYAERARKDNFNKSFDPEVREKISNTLKIHFTNKENHWAYGLKMDEQHREKLRKSKLNNPKNVGNRKPRTEEQKQKVRNSVMGMKIKRCKIEQYEMNMVLVKIWDSMREIERYDDSLRRNQISKCCKGIRESYAGFIWRYKED